MPPRGSWIVNMCYPSGKEDTDIRTLLIIYQILTSD